MPLLLRLVVLMHITQELSPAVLQENSKATKGLPLLDPLLQEAARALGRLGWWQGAGRRAFLGVSDGVEPSVSS